MEGDEQDGEDDVDELEVMREGGLQLTICVDDIDNVYVEIYCDCHVYLVSVVFPRWLICCVYSFYPLQ